MEITNGVREAWRGLIKYGKFVISALSIISIAYTVLNALGFSVNALNKLFLISFYSLIAFTIPFIFDLVKEFLKQYYGEMKDILNSIKGIKESKEQIRELSKQMELLQKQIYISKTDMEEMKGLLDNLRKDFKEYREEVKWEKLNKYSEDIFTNRGRK